MKVVYDVDTVTRLTINPIAEANLVRVADAMNGLTNEFGQEWVESHLYHFDLRKLCGEFGLPSEALINHFTDFDDLVLLWEDFEVLRPLDGFDDFLRKLRKGRREDNVDLEVSIAADLQRITKCIELEPILADGKSKADLRFKHSLGAPWTYVEITRKEKGIVEDLRKERGERLAALTSARDPSRRHYIGVVREMDLSFSEADYNELLEWIPGSSDCSILRDIAFVGSVAHNEDEGPFVLGHFQWPVSMIQSCDISTGSFGVAYLRIPDGGAKNKIGQKSRQTMPNSESILFVDLSITHGSQAEWDDQIAAMDEAGNFSAVVTLRCSQGSNGFTRECKILEPLNASVPLSEFTREVLAKFAAFRIELSLA